MKLSPTSQRLAWIFSGLVCMLVAYGVYENVRPQKLGQVTLAVSVSPLSTPFFIAESQGFFADEGLEAVVLPCVGGHKCFLELKNKQADFATSSDSVVMFNSFAEAPDFQLLASFVKSSNDVKLITFESPTEATNYSMSGKRVGVIQGSASEYFLHLYLLMTGASSDDINIVYGSAPSLTSMLIHREIDAAVVWEPFVYQTLQENPALNIVDTKGLYDLSFTLLAQPSANQDGELAKQQAVLRALNKATDYINTEPELAQKIVYQRLHKDAEFIQWIWPDLRFQLTLDYALKSELESQARWAINEGIVVADQLPDYNRVLNSLPLQTVAPAAGMFE